MIYYKDNFRKIILNFHILGLDLQELNWIDKINKGIDKADRVTDALFEAYDKEKLSKVEL